MADVFWTPDRAERADEVPAYSVEVCLLTNGTLYVIIAGPAPNDGPPQPAKIAARSATGDDLHWRGQSSSGQRSGQIMIGRFDPPNDLAAALDVAVVQADETVFSVRAIPRTVQ